MSIDFGKPLNTDLATGVLAQLRENVNSILTQGFGAGANLPTSSLRINPTTGIIESFNGSVWSRFGPLLSYWGGTSGGSANVQTITVIPTPSALADGQIYYCKSGFTNTASMTLNPNSLGSISVYDSKTGVALVGYEIYQNMICAYLYSGGVFYLLNGRKGRAIWNATLTAAGSMTVSSQTNYMTEYSWDGTTFQCQLDIEFQIGGTVSSLLYLALPSNVSLFYSAGKGDIYSRMYVLTGGVNEYNALIRTVSNTSIGIYRNNGGSNFSLGAAKIAGQLTLLRPRS
jgi:hypothetical protein